MLSLADAGLGVVTSASLAVSMIGHALAQARGLIDKHAVKQVDRLLSNQGVQVWDLFAPWVRHAVGAREKILVAMDWTDFDADNQTTLALHLVTGHGRATPLIWLTVDKDELKNRRNDFEDACLSRLKECLPEDVAVTILADRGFGDVKLFAFLESLGFDYAIRFRGNIQVAAENGETRPAADWVGAGGRARMLRDVEITAARRKVPAVVCVHAKDMKEPWCIATSHRDATAREIVDHYSKRWTIEPGFRDAKNLRFGMGMSVLRIADPQRRDRLFLLSAIPACVDILIFDFRPIFFSRVSRGPVAGDGGLGKLNPLPLAAAPGAAGAFLGPVVVQPAERTKVFELCRRRSPAGCSPQRCSGSRRAGGKRGAARAIPASNSRDRPFSAAAERCSDRRL